MGEDLSVIGQKWLLKAGMSGNAFRLPDKIESGQFEMVLGLWYTCFCGNMKADQVKTMRNFKFLWRRDDDRIASRPIRGIARNLEELQFLMSSGRIDRSEFKSITDEQWSSVVEYTDELVFETMAEIKVGNVVTQEATTASPTPVLTTLDAVVSGITNGYYDVENAGATTKAYFKGAKAAFDAMEVVYSNMEMYLTRAIVPSFAYGSYASYDSLMAALRRYYGEDECQETMVDVIKKVLKIVKKDARMEQKIAEFRELSHRLMIVEKSKWIKPRDFTDDRTAFMEAAENYGPMLNTMFTAMVFSHTIPQSRWNNIQALFNARVPETSYKAWHENRPELYKILDAEKKGTGAIANVDVGETIGFAGSKSKSNRRTVPVAKRNSNRKSQKPKKSTKSAKTSDKICRHCSQHANKLFYHDGPYGGGKNCRYGKNGKIKSTRKVNAVKEGKAGTNVSEDENENEDDDDSTSGSENEDESDGEVGALYEDYLPSFGGGCFGGNI